jgi:hypothetical protein
LRVELDGNEYLEALPVDDGWSGFVVFLLADPHLLEGGEGSEDGASDPDGVFSFGWSDDLDLHRGWSEGCDLLLHAIGDAWEHGRASRQDGVGVQIFTNVDVALHDTVVGRLVDAARFHTEEAGLEHRFRASEPLVSDGDDLTVGKFVALLEGRRGGCGGHLLFEVEGDIAQLLLDVSHDFPLGRGGEAVASLGQDLHQVVCEISSGQVETEDGVWQGITFVDRDGVGDTIAGVEHDTGGTTGSVQGQDSLDGNVHGWRVEGLEHDLGHLFSVGLRVEWGLGQQDWVLLWGNSELVVERVMPDLLHIVPVCDDTVFDRVLEGEDTTLALGFVSNVAVFLAHADHHTLMSWSANDGREDGSRSVVSGESCLAHSGSIVDNEGCYVIIHLGM